MLKLVATTVHDLCSPQRLAKRQLLLQTAHAKRADRPGTKHQCPGVAKTTHPVFSVLQAYSAVHAFPAIAKKALFAHRAMRLEPLLRIARLALRKLYSAAVTKQAGLVSTA